MDEVHMHQNFADWYRTVSLTPQSDTLQRRWKAVQEFAKECSGDDVADLARLFYSRSPRHPEFLDKFRSAFKTSDDTFPMRDNDPELCVLAGSCLVDLFAYPDNWGDAAALAILAANCRGLRIAPLPDIPVLARKHLEMVSAALRTTKFDPPALGNLAEKLAAAKTAMQANQLPQLNEPLGTLLQMLIDAAQGLTKYSSHAAKEQELRSEESEVLWWLVGGYSRDLEKPFQDLPKPSAILIGAKELANLVRILPGPLSASAFLWAALHAAHPDLSGKVSLSETISACPLEWQKSFINVSAISKLDDLCPVHGAIEKSVEAAGNKAWHTAFKTLTGLKASDKFDPLDLARQTYDERMLMRAVEHLK